MYTIVTLIQLQLQISDKKEESASYDKEIVAWTRRKEVAEEKKNNIVYYLEQKAREQGLSKPGESIYVETPGD